MLEELVFSPAELWMAKQGLLVHVLSSRALPAGCLQSLGALAHGVAFLWKARLCSTAGAGWKSPLRPSGPDINAALPGPPLNPVPEHHI